MTRCIERSGIGWGEGGGDIVVRRKLMSINFSLYMQLTSYIMASIATELIGSHLEEKLIDFLIFCFWLDCYVTKTAKNGPFRAKE
jgi:hypothetical protein